VIKVVMPNCLDAVVIIYQKTRWVDYRL